MAQPRADQSLVTDRGLSHLPEGLFEQRAAEISALMQTHRVSQGDGSRWQEEIIAREIPVGASVLDLGCGDGFLLERLIRERGVRGQGVEIDPDQVFSCVDRGVPVIQADLGAGLAWCQDKTFDVVVLEETLQTLQNPRQVLEEMLRVGRRGIVSFPNFAHYRVVVDLAARCRMPVTERLPYRWYESANIHLLTLRDLLDWASSSGALIVSGHVLVDGIPRELRTDDDLVAEEVLVVVERG
ncbi:MAG: methionine biosynthesis protein MetW [Polyangia bacterium]|jgi:methionine biosynthesis protein MetW